MKTILFIFGTRPEAIKCAPLILEMKKNPDTFNVKVCVTAQHREMLDQVLTFFDIPVDFDLDLMTPNQSLPALSADVLTKVDPIIESTKPDLVFVQGDTTSTYMGALAAYYNQVPVAHLEAGLRSGNRYDPFPEEINRLLTAKLATYHFASTPTALNNLNSEGLCVCE